MEERSIESQSAIDRTRSRKEESCCVTESGPDNEHIPALTEVSGSNNGPYILSKPRAAGARQHKIKKTASVAGNPEEHHASNTKQPDEETSQRPGHGRNGAEAFSGAEPNFPASSHPFLTPVIIANAMGAFAQHHGQWGRQAEDTLFLGTGGRIARSMPAKRNLTIQLRCRSIPKMQEDSPSELARASSCASLQDSVHRRLAWRPVWPAAAGARLMEWGPIGTLG